MRPDDLDVPLAFLTDAQEALDELPRDELPEDLKTHFGNLQVRLQALLNSADIFQRRLATAGNVRRIRRPAATLAMPVAEEADL
jgi:hypothetical protein